MKKVLVSKDDVVVNIIEIEDKANYSVAPGLRLVDYEKGAEIGGTYINGIFIPPDRVPNLKDIRRGELKAKFESKTGTLDEVQEFLADHV